MLYTLRIELHDEAPTFDGTKASAIKLGLAAVPGVPPPPGCIQYIHI